MRIIKDFYFCYGAAVEYISVVAGCAYADLLPGFKVCCIRICLNNAVGVFLGQLCFLIISPVSSGFALHYCLLIAGCKFYVHQ